MNVEEKTFQTKQERRGSLILSQMKHKNNRHSDLVMGTPKKQSNKDLQQLLLENSKGGQNTNEKLTPKSQAMSPKHSNKMS